MGVYNPCQPGHMHTTLHSRIKAIWLVQEHHAAPLKALNQRKERVWHYCTLCRGNGASQKCHVLEEGCGGERCAPSPVFQKGLPQAG